MSEHILDVLVILPIIILLWGTVAVVGYILWVLFGETKGEK
jgi:hypothetical protein